MAGWLDGWLPLCHGGCATHHLSLGSGASPCATIMRIPTAGHASIALECHDSTNFQDSCWRLRASFDIRNPLPPALRKEGHPCVICRFGSLSTTSAQPPLSTSDLTPVCLVQRSCRQRSCPQEPGIAGMSESVHIRAREAMHNISSQRPPAVLDPHNKHLRLQRAVQPQDAVAEGSLVSGTAP